MSATTRAVFSISVALLITLSASAPSAFGSNSRASNGSPLKAQSTPMLTTPGQTGSFGPSYTKSESLNWAGYAVSGVGVIDRAQGSWVQTKATCNKTASGEQIAVFWTGIDGFASSTVEQIGTMAECAQGKSTPHYFAWYEFFPAQSIITISNFTVHVGDVFIATVVAKKADSYTLILNDTTSGQSFTVKNPSGFIGERSSAECITEEPEGSNGFFLLTQYAKDPWGIVNTGLSGCTANGKPFGSFHANAYEITDVNENNRAVMDQPTKLSNGTSFFMIWKSAGP